MELKKLIVLYIDDENINLRAFKSTFRREFTVYTANSATEGLKILQSEKVDVVITDQRMPDTTGVELLKKIQELFPSIPPSRLILSGFSKTQAIKDAYTKYNLFKFISKPWNKKNIRQVIYESIKAENYTPAENPILTENIKKEKYNILYVDDEEINLKVFESDFRREFNVFKAISPKEGFKIIEKNKIQVVISDQRMPEMSGIEFLKKVKSENPIIKLIILTGYTDYEVLKEAINRNVLWGYLNKPYDYENLKSVILGAGEAYQLEIDKIVLQNELDLHRELLDNMMDNALDGIITIDDNHNIVNINKAACKLFKYNFDQLIGKPINLLIPKDKHNIFIELFNSFRNKKTITKKLWSQLAIVGLNSKREKIYLESSLSMQKNPSGYYYHAFVRDITAKLKVEKKHRESELRLKEAQYLTHIGHWNYNHVTDKHYWSDELYRILGMLPGEIEANSKSYSNTVHKDDKETYYNALGLKKPFDINYRLQFKDSSIKYVHHINKFIVGANGNTTKSFGTVQDITKQEKIREELELSKEQIEASEKQFRELYEKSGDAILIIKNGNFIDCNAATVNMLNYKTKNEFLNTHPSKLSPKHQPDGLDSFTKAEQMINLALEKGTHRFEWTHTKSNGMHFPVEVLLTAITNEPQNKVIHCVWRDITDRKNSEKNIIESNQRFNQLANNTSDVFWIGDTIDINNIKWLYISPAFEKVWQNTPEELYQDASIWYNCVHKEDIERTETTFMNFLLEKTKTYNVKFRIVRNDGTIRNIAATGNLIKDANGKVIRVAGISRDVTEQVKNEEEIIALNKNLEGLVKQRTEELIQSEKMASLGVLTAGIAHEINNPINFISSGTHSLDNDFKDLLHILKKLKTVPKNEESLKERAENIRKIEEEFAINELIQYIPQTIEDIKEGINRTTEIIKGLLLYSRSDESELQKANIHKSIDGSLVLLKDKLKNTIQIVKKYNLDIEDIECYPGQLSQVFTNLIDNAIDAINNKGTITITTTLKNKQVVISIQDTGEGISDPNLTKIFDPFFTTKEVGKGTGLGLSICQGIINNHKGSIEVKSKDKKGTEFIITLPINFKQKENGA